MVKARNGEMGKIGEWEKENRWTRDKKKEDEAKTEKRENSREVYMVE